MNVRPAESNDRPGIRAVAYASFRSSYSLSPQGIDTILEEDFDDEPLAECLDDPDTAVFVAEGTIDETEKVVGFAIVALGSEATIRWLHVDPEARGEGIATALVDRIREDAGGRPIRGRVLNDAVEGGTFLEECGLQQDGSDRITVGGEEFAVALFTEGEATQTPNEPTVTVPETVTVGGERRSVDRDNRIPGTEAPFFQVFSDEAEEDAYGYFCSECGSTDVSADGLDRLECGECGNSHQADEWDGAYL